MYIYIYIYTQCLKYGEVKWQESKHESSRNTDIHVLDENVYSPCRCCQRCGFCPSNVCAKLSQTQCGGAAAKPPLHKPPLANSIIHTNTIVIIAIITT